MYSEPVTVYDMDTARTSCNTNYTVESYIDYSSEDVLVPISLVGP